MRYDARVVDPELVAQALTLVAVADAVAASMAWLPGLGVPLGGDHETLDLSLPENLAEMLDPKDALVSSDLYGSSSTFASWRSATRIAFATPFLWSINGLGASPVTGWIDVLPGVPERGKTTFRCRRVARLWPILLLAAFAVRVSTFGSVELTAGVAVPVLLVVLFVYRPTARIAAGMYHEITANLARLHGERAQ